MTLRKVFSTSALAFAVLIGGSASVMAGGYGNHHHHGHQRGHYEVPPQRIVCKRVKEHHYGDHHYKGFTWKKVCFYN